MQNKSYWMKGLLPQIDMMQRFFFISELMAAELIKSISVWKTLLQMLNYLWSQSKHRPCSLGTLYRDLKQRMSNINKLRLIKHSVNSKQNQDNWTKLLIHGIHSFSSQNVHMQIVLSWMQFLFRFTKWILWCVGLKKKFLLTNSV